jgi:hypothetical protein
MTSDRTCFVICPIGEDESETRRRADQVLSHIVRPAAEGSGYNVERADILVDQDPLPESISRHLLNDELVIADLTNRNPNVLYELGKRHAYGGHCLHLTSDPHQELPFDVRHYRVIAYDLADPDKVVEVRRVISEHISYLSSVPAQVPFPLTPDQLIRLSGTTVLVECETGRREHYYRAQEILTADARRIFLMQRSSSLVLGPEVDWEAEKTFHHALLERISAGADFYHIVSLEGIRRHLNRPYSIFPDVEETVGALTAGRKGEVGIRGKDRVWYFKRIPETEETADIKPDRQARALLVEYRDGTTTAVIVFDLGGQQFYFHLRGKKIGDLMRDCIDFYARCPYLRSSEIQQILQEAATHNED